MFRNSPALPKIKIAPAVTDRKKTLAQSDRIEEVSMEKTGENSAREESIPAEQRFLVGVPDTLVHTTEQSSKALIDSRQQSY